MKRHLLTTSLLSVALLALASAADAGPRSSKTIECPAPQVPVCVDPTPNPNPLLLQRSSEPPIVGTKAMVTLTFYGYPDNDCGGGGGNCIATPVKHSVAGGTGTYADPITFATKEGWLAAGTIIYVPHLHKYFIREDDCASCTTNWIDPWIGPTNGPADPQALLACENAMTPDQPVEVIIDPATTLPVDITPLYSDAGGCYTKTY
jgi:hypothetical protein